MDIVVKVEFARVQIRGFDPEVLEKLRNISSGDGSHIVIHTGV